ncbi:hypothetical protein JHK87_033871 [Glycine soja]|nr:hypothetical protein JHK87_033871 [Glycine soja]
MDLRCLKTLTRALLARHIVDSAENLGEVLRGDRIENSHVHEYDGEWDNTRRLTTCDPHAKKLVSGSEPPQEVEDKEGDYFYL